MTHLSVNLPPQVEQGAVRNLDYSTEIVTTDGGTEVRNARWSTPLRSFDISFPTAKRTDATYIAVKTIFDDSLGGLHTFNFKDWTTDDTVKVRFDSALSITGIDIRHDHIESVRLVEVRE